jgi:hypothetical protein
MLVGRFGLFANLPPEGTPPPTLRHGRILGLYMGGVYEAKDTDTELAVAQAHPGYTDYTIHAPRRGRPDLVYSGMGMANSIAFANTALGPSGTGKPQYDGDRLNAVFMPFEVTITDPHGKEHHETVMAAVAFDNLLAPSNPKHMVMCDYEENYIPIFEQQAEQARQHAQRQADLQRDIPDIKHEPPSP